MDRNSIIGFVLLLLLGTGYIFWNNHQQSEYLAQKTADSVARAALMPPVDTLQKTIAAAGTQNSDANPIVDSSLAPAYRGEASTVKLDNGYLNLSFNTKGGFPTRVALDSFKTYYGDSLAFFNGDNNKLSFNIPVDGKTIATEQLYFTPHIENLANGGKSLTMTADLGDGKKVILSYALASKSYMINTSFRLVGFQQDLASVQGIKMVWNTEALHTEKDIDMERQGRAGLQVHFRYKDGEHDYFTLKRTPQKSLDKPIEWFSVRSDFFNSTIIADQEMTKASFDSKEPQNDTNVIAFNSSDFTLPVMASSDYSFNFRWLISPNDYQLLKSYKLDLEEIIPLGFGPFFFVKYISKWFVIPLFNFLANYVSIGLAIILMTLIIRLALSFFTYKSHLSSAKMRVLKPELDELKKRIGDNQQQMGVEQMKLYKSAGVNPLGGCLPMLLQMPFLLAMYYFIPTAIQLRQASFLWAPDLSTYDSILDLGFKIPFYGDHVSLFTLMMAATSLILAVYSKNMTGGAPGGDSQMNAMMKYMPYVMPFMFLGWFNTMAAGLTFYYTFSNLISIAQQFIIQKFIIDEKAIHAKIQEKKLKPASTSKWQQKLEEMQKMQAEKAKKK